MAKRVFIIHGWDGCPDESWFPWLKQHLEAEGFEVCVPEMPNSPEPKMDEWVHFLDKLVINPDSDTFFVGHSIGCQTIMRYLENLDQSIKLGGIIFVAGWINLTPETIEDPADAEIAAPWLESQINWNLILPHSDNFTAIFSDNDPHVPLTDADIFKDKLGAKIIIEHDKGHFSGDDNITELPSVLTELMNMAK